MVLKSLSIRKDMNYPLVQIFNFINELLFTIYKKAIRITAIRLKPYRDENCTVNCTKFAVSS